MGVGGISIWQLLIILAIVVLLFGTKRLRGFGTDLGSAIKGFRQSMNNGESEAEDSAANGQIAEKADDDVIDGTATRATEESETKT